MAKKVGKTALPGVQRRGEIFGMNPNDLVIVTDPTHPLFDGAANDLPLDERLIASFEQDGVLEAVKVVKDGDRVLVSEGRQRVKNACELWRRQAKRGVPVDERITVPVVRDRAPLETVAGHADTLQTLRRVEVFSVRAEKAHRAIHAMGQPIGKVAVRFGVDVKTLQSWLKVYEGSSTLVRAVDRGAVPFAAAVKLAGLPRDEQAAKVKEVEATRAARPKDKSGRKLKKITSFERAQKIAQRLDGPSLAIVLWVIGKSTDAELVKAWPALADLFPGVKEVGKGLPEVQQPC